MCLRILDKLLVTCLLAAPALAALAQSTQSPPILGVLRLPEVFGNGPCDRFTPREIPVFRTHGARYPYATIGVASPWIFPAGGGCEGLRVVLRRDGSGSEGVSLPAAEFGYEKPGAIVLQHRSNWYEIAVPDGTGWVRVPDQPAKSDSVRFISVGQLASMFRDSCGQDRSAKAASVRPRLGPDGRPTQWFSTRGC